jgi:intracellular sulfur oxidation DsrE/DsrF family protein
MKTLIVLIVLILSTLSVCQAQVPLPDSTSKAQQDSLKRVKAVADSLKWEKLLSVAQYPYVKGSKWSGVIPVADPAWAPDLKQDYKLLFEVSEKNPDSLSKEISMSLDDVARILNLHFTSGIPPKQIIPVVVLHGPGLDAVLSNEAYKKRHSLDNPNIKLVHDLMDVGAKFIVCGQAMAFKGLTKEDILPEMKIALTAQTVLSSYQLQGYVLYALKENE